MRSALQLPPLLLLLLWAAPLPGPSLANAFVVPSRTPTRRTSLGIHHQQTALFLATPEGEEMERTTNISHFLKQQKVVAWTGLVVALATVATRQIPYQTLRRNMLAGTLIFSVGDWGAQLLTHYQSKSMSDNRKRNAFVLDKNRFVISAILGSVWAGICNPSVYALAESILPGASNMGRVLMKMAISCSILSTVGNYVTMMVRRFLKQSLDSSSRPRQWKPIFQACIASCNRDFLPVLKDDLKVWPLYDIICYSLIPPNIRPITNAFMASAWSMYMSIASAQTTPTSVRTTDNDTEAPTLAEEQLVNPEVQSIDKKSLVAPHM